jgi:hypothetical protein
MKGEIGSTGMCGVAAAGDAAVTLSERGRSNARM